MNINRLLLKEVGFFHCKQVLQLRPLTLLVGDNCTGKTTAFAAYDLLSSAIHCASWENPLHDRLVAPRSKTCTIGYGFESHGSSGIRQRELFATFRNDFTLAEVIKDLAVADVVYARIPPVKMHDAAQQAMHGISEETLVSVAVFGRSAGLFQDVRIELGNMPDTRLQVKCAGRWVSFKDAGGGIQHIVPMLTKIFSMPARTHLLQYPERCLGHQVQATFASLLARLAIDENRTGHFVIETDSDAIIDRVRIDIRTGRIPPEDVSLAYFQHRGSKHLTHIHNIAFDRLGNFKGTPPGYRAWHLRESDRLMGFLD